MVREYLKDKWCKIGQKWSGNLGIVDQAVATRVVKLFIREKKEATVRQIRQRNLQTTSEVGSDEIFSVEP